MAQQLIVEGKDAIALANLLKKRSLPSPLGYETSRKFSNDFVKQAGSVSKVDTVLENALLQPSMNNIGIIVDANNVGAEERLNNLIKTITKTLNYTFQAQPKLTSRGFTTRILPELMLGIWIMPNNQDDGYLEHFLLDLIEKDNELLVFAKAKIEELIVKGMNRFSKVKKEKAILEHV
ncbi:MAG: DUF3226 domain-containing protein [Bacteroidota bacterium]